MFAVILVPHFALQSLLRHEPELCDQPVALVEAVDANLSKALILECTRAAEAAGVAVGFTAPQAQARCRDVLLKSRQPRLEQSATELLLQTAYAFSPHLEHTASGVCTIDLRGLTFGENQQGDALAAQVPPATTPDAATQRSFDFFEPPCASATTPMEAWARTIVTTFESVGLHVQVGVAVTPNLALLAARAAAPVLVIQRPEEFFASLPVAALEPSPYIRDVLNRWGIHTAGAFLALGRHAIAERLGAEALELFQRASVRTIRPLNVVVPADTFVERMDFEAHIETIEPLLFVLRRFVEQLTTRIALTYRVIAELRLTLVLESGASHAHTLKVPAPTSNVETLFRMLHTHLENLRTDAPVASLQLAAVPVRAEGQQFALFESALRDPNHFHETLARLVALLGPDRVGTPIAEATHRPDAFRMKTTDFQPTPTPAGAAPVKSSTALCLRRFRSPIHAEVEQSNGQPIFISTIMMSARIRRARGPWCTSGTWWDPRRWARQEWDVETDKGELYRLRHADGQWVLEGVYD